MNVRNLLIVLFYSLLFTSVAEAQSHHAVVISPAGEIGYAQAASETEALDKALEQCPTCQDINPRQYYRSGPIDMNLIALYCAEATPDSFATRAYDRGFAVRAAYAKAQKHFLATQCQVLDLP